MFPLKELAKLMKTIAYFARTILICIFSISTFILVSCSQSKDFTLLSGESHSLSDYQGKWLIVNFWAEWCAPCLEEIPELNLVYQQKMVQNLELIGISYEPLTNQQLQQQVKKWDIQYPIIATDPMPMLTFELPPTLPTNYIINPDGVIVAKLAGTQTAQSLTKALNAAKKDYVQ
jgi:thiol-disulfide isomerase/thioredoxin